MPISKAFLIPAIVLATTLVASAQVVPNPGIQIPPPENSSAQRGGIAEQGRGIVGVPADRLRLSVHVFPNGPGGATPPGTGPNPLDVVAAAMRANGIPDAHVVVPIFGSFGNGSELAGTIAKPTARSVSEIEMRIVAALPPSVVGSLRNVNVNGVLEADDCSAATDRARKLAYADARKRAEAFASVAGVRLGDLISANEYDQTFGCGGTGLQQGGFFNGNGQPTSFEIQVTTNVNATFAILR